MRPTLEMDEALVAKAQAVTGIGDISTLVRVALVGLIERESARRLGLLGGSDPEAAAPGRRVFETA